MISSDKLATVRTTIEKLAAQSQTLFTDISETVSERERLLKEAEDREQVIDKLNAELKTLTTRNDELEKRNDVLAADAARLESLLADATARLSSIQSTAQFEAHTPREITSINANGNAVVTKLRRPRNADKQDKHP